MDLKSRNNKSNIRSIQPNNCQSWVIRLTCFFFPFEKKEKKCTQNVPILVWIAFSKTLIRIIEFQTTWCTFRYFCHRIISELRIISKWFACKKKEKTALSSTEINLLMLNIENDLFIRSSLSGRNCWSEPAWSLNHLCSGRMQNKVSVWLIQYKFECQIKLWKWTLLQILWTRIYDYPLFVLNIDIKTD